MIQKGGVSPITWVLGIDFMENYYVAFDNENYRVGLAPSYNASPRIKALYQKSSDLVIEEEDKHLGPPAWRNALIWGVLIIMGLYNAYKFVDNYFKARVATENKI